VLQYLLITNDVQTSEEALVSQDKRRILVVDDEPDLTLLYRLSLELAGFKVETYNDSSEALSNFRPGSYDLIILDIKMPVMDGFSLYEELKKKDSNAKICFLTAGEMYHQQYRLDKYNSLERNLFLRKPISSEDLIKEITAFITGD
jgi:DNA-binding response OmpR family regulator